MLSKKSFGGIYENFLKLLMRSMRGDVRDHIASQKNDHGLSYRHYKASQRRSSPKITICEIFGVVRFSTFSTASVKSVALCNGRLRLDFRYTLLATKLARHCNMSRWANELNRSRGRAPGLVAEPRR
jgi:hypothetical protein